MVVHASYKAVVIHGPARASLEKLPLPEVGPRDVLIKVAYVGICATDIEILKGELGYYRNGMGRYPITPGHEFSGTIASVGREVEALDEGMPVVVECLQTCRRCQACRSENWIGCKERKEVGVLGRDGACAEYVLVPDEFVHALPAQTGLRQAALCEPAAVVLKGLRRSQRVLGQGNSGRYAVVGAGAIGHLCARILALRGYEVRVFDQTPSRLVYFHGSTIQTSAELTGWEEFDAIVEATGSPQALQLILEKSRPGCVLLLLGLPYASQPFSFETLVGYDKTVVGSVGSTAADFREAIHLLPRLDLTPFLQKTLPLEQYREAWDLFHTRQFLKVMMAVNPS
jgi:2-desacetyl-2-hydroxyethyl bacteriochlorophyllide A dehydrogenase